MFDDWMQRGVKRDALPRHAVRVDRWDKQDLEHVASTVDQFSAGRQKLGEFTPTGKPAMEDTLWALLKAKPDLADPQEVDPAHLVNRVVAEELHSMPDFERLRRFTVGDDVQAALSANDLEPDLETLFDRLEQEVKQAEELAQTLAALAAANEGAEDAQRDLDELEERWANGEGSQEEVDEAKQKAEDAQGEADDLQSQAEAQVQALSDALDDVRTTIQATMHEAIRDSADDAKGSQETAKAWGMSPGEFQRLPADERIALAKRLNNDRTRRIADLFGPMRNLMLSEQARKTTNVPEEIFDVEEGAQIERLLPSELSRLSHPIFKKDFYKRFATKKLLQFAMRGEERLARGGIIMCEDGSGSMHGERELWSKALMLSLLHLARQQKRTFHLIHFGSAGQIKHIPFVRSEDFSLERILDAAELFAGGGTDFHTPLQKSLEILEEEFDSIGGIKSDVVFVTDGESGIDPTFGQHYRDEMERMQAITWGIQVNERGAIGHRYNNYEGLIDVCGGGVATIQDFLSGNDIRHIFRGVT